MKHNEMVVMDLGSGVGRNAIQIARNLVGTNGRVICVDILDIAIERLEKNAIKHNVLQYIEGIQSSIEDYNLCREKYDFVFGVSALEHIESKRQLEEVLSKISKQTKSKGINCFILNTSIKEFSKNTSIELTPQFEINLPTNEMTRLFESIYKDWEIIKKDVKKYQFNIDRNDEPVILDTSVLTFVVRNR